MGSGSWGRLIWVTLAAFGVVGVPRMAMGSLSVPNAEDGWTDSPSVETGSISELKVPSWPSMAMMWVPGERGCPGWTMAAATMLRTRDATMKSFIVQEARMVSWGVNGD